MRPFIKALAASFCLAFSAPAVAEPASLGEDTRTNQSDTDLKRIASLAESIEGFTGKLALALYSIPQTSCALSKPCAEVATNIVVPMRDAARDLKALARAHGGGTVSNQFMQTLRSDFFNDIAVRQHELRKTFEAHGRSGSTVVDLACSDLLDIYWVLMNQMVVHPREFDGGGGRGAD